MLPPALPVEAWHQGRVLGTGLQGVVWVFPRWKLCQVPAVLGAVVTIFPSHGCDTPFFPPSPLLRPKDLGDLLSCPPGHGRPCLDPGTPGQVWLARTYSRLLRASAVQYASMGAATASNSASCSSSSSPGAKSGDHPPLTPRDHAGSAPHPCPGALTLRV